MVGVNEPVPEPEGGDAACWAHEFEALLYGEQHTFAMRALPEGGTEVRITLPFRAGLPEVAQHAHAAGADRGR